jgi:IclR family transcriptional regulator, KDG regulon repressor
MRRPEHSDPSNNQSLMRALELLGCFGFDHQELGLTELTRISGLPKATVHRLASTLVFCRFLNQDSDSKRYSLGPKLFELGSVAHASFSLRRIASPHLKRFNFGCVRTALLGVLQDDELLYLDKEDGTSTVRLASEIGRRRPPHFGILGQVLMAYLPEREMNRLLEISPLQRFTKKSVTDPEAFKERLRTICRQGFVIEDGEAHESIAGVAAPVRDFTGKVIAALGVAFISGSADHQAVMQIIADTVRVAAEISRDAGYVDKGVEGPAQMAGLA